jgi:hypothetical protein
METKIITKEEVIDELQKAILCLSLTNYSRVVEGLKKVLDYIDRREKE